MIHYHGMPITPLTAAARAIDAGHAFVSFVHPDQLPTVIEVCQSFAIDNGAFSSWMAGKPITDWSGYYVWAAMCKLVPSCDFAVVPDVIDGDEAANDALLDEWPMPRWFGAPVWHMHESFDRLERMARDWPRICIGSSGEFATVGSESWWLRIANAMQRLHKATRISAKARSRAKLTPEIVQEIRASDEPQHVIAARYGVVQSTVSQIKRGVTWQDYSNPFLRLAA